MTECTVALAAGVSRGRRATKHGCSEGLKWARCASKMRNQNSGLSSQKSGTFLSLSRRGTWGLVLAAATGAREVLATAVAAAEAAAPMT